MTTRTMARAAVGVADLVKVDGAGDTTIRAVDGVTLDFDTHQLTAIMGPSGSGKSTLMHCAAGLDTPTSGTVHIGQTDITRLSDKALTRLRRERVGFVFQSFNLLPTLTAEQNVLLPLELAGRRPDRVVLLADGALAGYLTEPTAETVLDALTRLGGLTCSG